MMTIDTRYVKKTAVRMSEDARRYTSWKAELQQTVCWLKKQEFPEEQKLVSILTAQIDELEQQRRGCNILAEALHNVCDRYQRMEEGLEDSADMTDRIRGSVETVNLTGLKNQITGLGLELPEL